MKIKNVFFATFVALSIQIAGLSAHAQSWTMTNLYSFNYGGVNSFIQGNDGNFYGTMSMGGTNNGGSAFKLTTNGVFNTLTFFDFDPVAKFDRDYNTYYAPQDGPTSLMQGRDGNFYGTAAPYTYPAYAYNDGLFFQMTPAGVITEFYPGGTYPNGPAIQAIDGSFYGTTSAGGNLNLNNNIGDGAVYKITITTSPPTFSNTIQSTLVTLNDTNRGPRSALIQASDGNFYGVTAGFFEYTIQPGTIFKVTPTGVLTTLFSFSGLNGFNPQTALIQGMDGNLYGTTAYGGSSYGNGQFGDGDGTIFRMTTDGKLTTLISFNKQNGASPATALVQNSDGNFYGTTSVGGAYGHGTIFQMTTNGTLTTLISLDGTNGNSPNSFIRGADGAFYGTTVSGGTNGYGIAFRLIPPTPMVITTPATFVDSASAVLNCTINPNGLAAAIQFQYGTDTNYGQTTASQSLVGVSSNALNAALISQLSSSTVYHFRAVATILGSTYFGSDQTFVTAPSLHELANLCNNVYSGNADFEKYSFIGNNYTLMPDTATDIAFQAAAYSTADGAQIIVAIRGTVFSFENADTRAEMFTTLDADLSFGTSATNALMDEDASDSAQFIQLIQSQHPNAKITITGHSLGGALAQLVGEASGLPTVAFNAPGSGALYNSLKPELFGFAIPVNPSPNINYRIYGDQVSLFGTPILGGSTVTIAATGVDEAYVDLASHLDQAAGFMLAAYHFYYLHKIGTVIAQIDASAQQSPGYLGPNFTSAIKNALEPSSIFSSTSASITYNFAFNVSSTAGVLIDPTEGTDFVFSEQPGSPNFASLVLPSIALVSAYDVRFQTNGVWSFFQPLQPGVSLNFGSSVTGVEFIPVDSYGNALAMSNILFDASFVATGDFTGMLVESSAVPPLLPVLRINLVGNAMNIAWNTNTVSGFSLYGTTNMPPMNSWALITNSSVVINDQNIVTVPVQSKGQFFQLQRH